MQNNQSLDRLLATAAREMDDATSSERVLEVAVGWALSLVPGCEMAGVTVRRRRGRFESKAPSEPKVTACDELQYELEEGPCVDAVTDDPLVRTDDVSTDERWPRWGPQVEQQHGVRSMLSIRLFTSRRVHGALNLYAFAPAAFDVEAVDLARVLAVHVSVALRGALLDEQLQVAVDSRNLIGQAQGLLMERYSLDSERAFAVLTRISQDRNTRLVEVADHVVRRRELPGAEAPETVA